MKSFTKKGRSWLFIFSILCLGLTFLYVGCSEDTVITNPTGGNNNSSTKWSITPQTSGITETSIFEICVEPISGKIWAVEDTARRSSKRQKDLADISRLLEAYPFLQEKVPEDILSRLF